MSMPTKLSECRQSLNRWLGYSRTEPSLIPTRLPKCAWELFLSRGSSGASIRTTQRYTHLGKRALGWVRSPLDDLSMLDETQTG
jgi:hypothetical protein